jgi:hypothetical protein
MWIQAVLFKGDYAHTQNFKHSKLQTILYFTYQDLLAKEVIKHFTASANDKLNINFDLRFNSYLKV